MVLSDATRKIPGEVTNFALRTSPAVVIGLVFTDRETITTVSSKILLVTNDIFSGSLAIIPRSRDLFANFVNISSVDNRLISIPTSGKSRPKRSIRGILGNAKLGGDIKSTVYLVVQSPDLVERRRSLRHKFESNGGRVGDFDADMFFPDITVGYTERDLHESDGVIKNTDSSVASVKIVP